MTRPICALVVLLLLSSLPASAEHMPYPGRAKYSVGTQKMDAALACKGGKAKLDGREKHQPILLVHGTGVTREYNWSWNYWARLPDIGYEVCWVQLPSAALNDIQISSEYVARAIEVMHRKTGERVDVLGHSQGGLQPRWAIRFFPSGRFVADYISLATPNHGTAVADAQGSDCFESCWQMRTISRFIATLNDGDETPGRTHYTNIYTQTDELVQPTGTQALAGGSNILLQDLCPGRSVDHAAIAGDGVTYLLVIDALEHRGPADPSRLPADHCQETAMPGSSAPPPAGLPDWSGYESSEGEPPLRPYAR